MKNAIRDLALFGGSPEFLGEVLVGRPNTGDRERFMERLGRALDKRWLTNGGMLVQEFESRVAELAAVRNCIATCNATAGLEIVARALQLSGEVIVPSLTFVATAHALMSAGAEPVFCDVDPVTGCLDPALVEAAITARTRGIMGVHLWGRPCAVDELEKIAAANGLMFICDAAHALGCTAGGRPVGGFGDAEVFSFHATKVANSFEGGAIVTNDDHLADRIRAMCNFGMLAGGAVAMAGTNAKMSEAHAAMGLTSLDALPESIERNKRNHELYSEELDGVDGIDVVSYDEREKNNYHYLIVRIDEGVTGVDRDLILKILRAENVIARPYFSPGCHQMPPYSAMRQVVLPNTEQLAAQVLALPNGTAVSGEEINRICGILRLAVSHGGTVTERWRAHALSQALGER